ncbi:hypothetical protein EDD15DRAFT_2201952, partial [Pisolithus albus]
MSEELEAVRAIASVTDVVPHTLIGVDKYVHWTENVGSPNCPFPSWKKVLKPDVAEIAGHPWLLTAERRLDPENPTLATAATTPTPPHATPTPTTRDKGKEQPIESSVTRFGIKRAGRKVEEDDGESELDTTDQLIDDNGDETNPPRGRSTQRRARSTSRSPGKSRVKQEQVDELEDDVWFRQIECIPNPNGGVCKPCKSRKIRCSHSSRSSETTAGGPPKSIPSTSSTPRRNPSRTRKPARKRSASSQVKKEMNHPLPIRLRRHGYPVPSAIPQFLRLSGGNMNGVEIIVPPLKTSQTRAIPPAHGASSPAGISL